MNFVDTYWLYALIPLFIALAVLLKLSSRKWKMGMQDFASKRLLPELINSYSHSKKLFKIVLLALVIILLFIALARPQWGYKWEEHRARGIDILFALDVSKSMLAEDIRPNRLERAKYAILDLVNKLEGDRIGLIAFAGSAFLQCPLTLDYNAFRQTLEATDTSVIQQGGTDIAGAIAAAEPSFSEKDNFKFILLLTDGEDLEASGIEQAKIAAKDNVTIYTIGVGTPQGDLIPIRHKDGSIGYLKDSDGKIVKTKLDEDTLEKIASITGGFYVPLGIRGEGLQKVYQAGLNTIPKQELTSNLRKVPVERFQWPLGIAILFLIVEALTTTRANGKKNNILRFHHRNVAIFSLGLVLASLSTDLDASPQTAYAAYAKGNYLKAGELYYEASQKNPKDHRLKYNLGNSYYRDGNYEGAYHAYSDAITANDLELQEDSFFNLGNASYRIGQESLHTNPQNTIEYWEEALKYYHSAMDLNPEKKEAHENYDFVKQKLEELKKQQQQKEQQEQQQKNQEQAKEKQNRNNDKKNKDAENKNSDNKNDKKEKKQGSSDNNSKNKESNSKKEQPQEQNKKTGEQGEKDRSENNSDGINKDKGEGSKKDQPSAHENNSQEKKNNPSGKEKKNQNSSPKKEDDNKDDNENQNKGNTGDKSKEDGSNSSGRNQKNQRPGSKSSHIETPGRISREEARQLLNALQNNERKLPAASLGLGNGNEEDKPLKEW